MNDHRLRGGPSGGPSLGGDHPFLPDFCAAPRVLSVVVIAELLAIVLVLAPGGAQQDIWSRLGLTSLFIQWVALSVAALLCVLRPRLIRCSDAVITLASLALMLGVTLIIAEAAYRIMVELDLAVGLPRPGRHEFLARSLAISAIVTGLTLRYFYVQHQWRQQVQAELRTRLQALQARIRPHFLFNGMNTIASLIRARPEVAERTVEDLAELFRASLAEPGLVPLGTELALARRYLDLERLRLGARLRVSWDMDGLPQDALIPALTIQPLLENAVYHGIEPLPSGGEVEVHGRREGDRLRVEIRNPLAADTTRCRGGHQMAQDSVRQRLAAHFGERGRLAVETGHDCYRAQISFPYRRDETADRR
jgi:two-component system, LytTR family, sensor histidine kinase AlgZ